MIGKLLFLLPPAERKRAGLLMGMILMMAALDMVGVASIMPFIAVAANPGLIETNVMLKAGFEAASVLVGVHTTQQFLFLLGLLVFVLLVTSLSFKALTTYVQIRFALMGEYKIGKRLVEGYLYQPYSWFLNRNSADLGKAILSEVNNVINHGMMPLMTLLAQGAVAIALLTLLVVIDPLLALSTGLVLGSAYLLVFKILSGWLDRIGKLGVQANQNRFTAVSEAFGAIKDVKAGGLEQPYIERFSGPAEVFAKSHSTAQIISQLPRFLLETIAFGGMLLVVLYLMTRSGSFSAAMPIIALYAFAGYRLMPALQQVYAAFTQLRFIGPAINALHADLKALQIIDSQKAVVTPMQLRQTIALNDVTYSYPNVPRPALNGISLTIPAHNTIGLVGTTGSGKTTTVDLILGLLEPQDGKLTIDGQVITGANRREWQRSIGYVPQQIYLSDDTVAANIAFGVNPQDIDQKAVEHAARIANLHDFVMNGLQEGYASIVGERGVRLSGGQRQRIGIARALYHKPQVLVMDEATSALDNLTEQAVMEAVRNLGHEITIILIAHRLSTVRQCDKIYLLQNGEILVSGSYEQLKESSEVFRAMAKIN
jgi:ABC-type multidrug transport system fused ATPase/permease subunit